MDFHEARELFRRLKAQHQQGEIDNERLETEVGKIQVKDEQGRCWMIGIRSGDWYYLNDAGEWQSGDPFADDSQETRCLECGAPLQLDQGLCERCIASAVSQTRPDAYDTPTAVPNQAGIAHEGGGMRLALMVLGLVVLCVTLFAFQATASQWGVSISPSEPLASPGIVLSETEQWPPTLLPTATPPPPTATPARLVLEPSAAAGPTVASTATPPPTIQVAAPTPTMSPAPPSEPPPAHPLVGRVLFPLFDERVGTYHIFAAPMDGNGEIRQIVQQASQPDVNQTGHLAYRSWDNSSRGLMLSTLAADAPQRLISYSEAARPSWSPDGESLLFYSLQESDRKPRIYLALTSGEFSVVKRDNGTSFGEVPVWLSDDRFLARSCEEGRCGVHVMSLSGAPPVPLTTHTSDTAPAPSSDGQRVAFMSYRDDNWEIYLVGTDGNNLTRLTNDPANDGLPVWSPDGNHIAFVSDRGGKWAIWTMKADGTEVRERLTLPGSLDGRVRSAQEYESRGWIDERICWIPW